MEIRELTALAMDNGINWTSDLIGNNGDLDHAETYEEACKIIQANSNIIVKVAEDNNYYGEADTVQWWSAYIVNNNRVDTLCNEIKVTLDNDEYQNFIDSLSAACDTDLEYHAYAKLEVAKQYNNDCDIECDIEFESYD